MATLLVRARNGAGSFRRMVWQTRHTGRGVGLVVRDMHTARVRRYRAARAVWTTTGSIWGSIRGWWEP
ncbi:hypothetical protein GCM10027080_03560 [Pedococcus soli]